MWKRVVLLFIVIFIILFLIFPPKWELSVSKDNGNTYYTVSYIPNGYGKPLFYCLSKIDRDFAIRIMLPLEDCKVQNEIKAYYQKNLPKSLKVALKSSGNLHNPKLKPLINSFPSAFKSTSLYKKLSTTLEIRGYKLKKEVSFEKFKIFKTKNSYLFHADIWLHAKLR